MRRLPIMLLISTFLCATAAAQDLNGTLKHIADTGELSIGYVPDAPPMSFVDDDGELAGYTIALCATVAKAIKKATGLEEMKINYVPLILPEDRMRAIEDGLVDIECGSSTVTLSRRERVDFSLMTFITGGTVLSLKDSPIPTIGDLDGKTIAVVKGTTMPYTDSGHQSGAKLAALVGGGFAIGWEDATATGSSTAEFSWQTYTQKSSAPIRLMTISTMTRSTSLGSSVECSW